MTFFLYTLAGSLLTLLGVIALVAVHFQYSKTNLLTFSIPELTQGLAALPWPEWRDTSSWTSPQVVIFLLLLAGFAIKVPIFPFHTWLPLAHVEAPTAGSILLAGVLLKVGTYGLLRFNIGMTPLGAAALFPLLSTLAVIGIIYGALAALAQTDIKRLVAYSSVSHMGFIVLGIFAFNATGLDGSAIQMVNHGLTTGALFACVGMIYERYHTRDMTQLGGLWNRLPLLAFFMILAALGSAAVPGLNGFVGEFPILAGTFQTSRRAGVLGATGMVLGACYLLWMLRKVIFGPLREPAHQEPAGTVPSHHATGHDACPAVGWHEIAGLSPIMALIVAIGVFPRPFLEQIRPAVARLDDNLQSQLALANEPREAPTRLSDRAYWVREGRGRRPCQQDCRAAQSKRRLACGEKVRNISQGNPQAITSAYLCPTQIHEKSGHEPLECSWRLPADRTDLDPRIHPSAHCSSDHDGIGVRQLVAPILVRDQRGCNRGGDPGPLELEATGKPHCTRLSL